MFKKIVVVASLSTLLGCGIFEPRYKEGLLVGQNLQEDQVKVLAKDSSDSIDFASKIYTKPAIARSNDHLKPESIITDRLTYNIWEKEFFKIYCTEKGGELFYWLVNRNHGAFSGFRGHSNEFLTCEKDGVVESAMLNEAYGRDSQTLPYEIQITYAASDYFKVALANKKLNGYISGNGILAFPSTAIFNAESKYQYVSDNYTVLFDYTNITQEPVEMDILKSTITIHGTKYNVIFDKSRDGKDQVDWNFYNDGNSRDIFIGPEGRRHSKLRFNPGQRLYGEFKIKIPGRTKLSEQDIEKLTFNLDGIECKDFWFFSYYERYKKRMSERKNLW